jgi:MFS family permease
MGRTFAALQIPLYRTFWLGTLVSFLGMQMQVIARGFLAYDLTGKNSALGLVMLGFGIPQFALGLWGGVIADRLPKRTTLIVAQLVIASNSAWVATMIATGHITLWMLVVASVVQGAGFAFVGPARQAFIGDLVGREHIGNAVVLQQMSMNSTRIIGPGLAGAFIGIHFIGLAGVYYMTTLGFIVACITMWRLPAGNPKPREFERSPLADLRDGISYVRRRPAILNLILTSFVVIMIAFPYQSFLPSVAKDTYGVGAGGLGALSTATAVGAIICTVLVAAYSHHKKAWFFAPVIAVAFGLSLVLFAATSSFALGLLALVLVGGLAAAFQSLNNSLTMSYTDEEYHGRVQSMTMMSWSLFGMASLPIGFIADHIGIRETLAYMGIIAAVLTVVITLIGRAQGAEKDRTLAAGMTPSRIPARGRGH